MRILFVEDNHDISALFSLVFGTQGHSTRVANNGAEAVRAVQQESFDAIVMDLEMPVMGGFEATRHIRQLPHGQRPPILIFTGYPCGRDDAIKAGANDLVNKPIDPLMLLDRLQATCGPVH